MGVDSIPDGTPLVHTSSDTKVTSGVMIRITGADGEESLVDVETIDSRPLTPSKGPFTVSDCV